MHVKYCCDSKAYQSYYLNQIGHGGPYFSGAPFQNGYGLGGIFSSLAKSIMPLIKSGAKAIGKLDGSLPANPVNDRRTANAVTLKSTFCLP